MANQPGFPPELEREIFETTAALHPTVVPVLLRVARRVLIWIEPFLYRVVIVQRTSKCRAMIDAIQSGSKPPEFFRRSIRHLCLFEPWNPKAVAALLNVCTGVVDVACSMAYGSPELLLLFGEMRPRRLTIVLEELFGGLTAIETAHPLFNHTTHLDVCDPLEEPSHLYAIIPTLPSITHLCLNHQLYWPAVDTLLTASPSLEVLVNLWGSKSEDFERASQYAGNIPFSDVRFVIGFITDYWGDWEAGANGLPNFWTRAEDFVAKKRRGEVDAARYWMD